MLNLPQSHNLPIAPLAGSFNQVTNSYKFYWFLSLLESVRAGDDSIIPLHTLLARMVAFVWYPIHYFRLSFGKQDQLTKAVILLAQASQLPADSPRSEVTHSALQHLAQQDNVGKQLTDLGNFVPYRFLRPFFAQQLHGEKDWAVNRRIKALAEEAFHSAQPCLYRFCNSSPLSIELHPSWRDYLQQHLSILTAFCLWHLIQYLQQNNPNVPNIVFKLFEPTSRDLKTARTFWKLVFAQRGSLTCIYSGKPLYPQQYSIDHFLPWRFVTHDLLWNLLPTSKEVNSSKSDSLPHPSYLEPFVKLHYEAVQTLSSFPQAPTLLEDYILLFKVSDVSELWKMEYSLFCNTLSSTIAPQLQIAANMGFPAHWVYKS